MKDIVFEQLIQALTEIITNKEDIIEMSFPDAKLEIIDTITRDTKLSDMQIMTLTHKIMLLIDPNTYSENYDEYED